jgi:acyl-CoA reductase-like NAD-dependent aldehyde dehydrogenase
LRSPDLGVLVSEPQAARFRALLDDALARGARLHTEYQARDGRIEAPAVLTNVTPAMRILREETFGPALSILPFRDEEEAVALANQSDYGLGASIWTGDLAKGRRVASRIEVGSVAINDVLKNVGHPGMPFGGVKSSGFGVARGPEGLRACCRPLSIMVNTSRAAREPNWFPYRRTKRRTIEALIHLLYADASWLERLRLLRKRWRLLWRERAPAGVA